MKAIDRLRQRVATRGNMGFGSFGSDPRQECGDSRARAYAKQGSSDLPTYLSENKEKPSVSPSPEISISTGEGAAETAETSPDARPAPEPIDWTKRDDVRTVVEDLADEGKKPGQISRLLGLRSGEIITILRRTGRQPSFAPKKSG